MNTADWSDDVFFETPERDSLDGGTTNAGALWHAVSPRWGHSMHTMCSYHGMFPAKVAHYFIQRYTKPGDLVMDPFSGRGTVALQARAEGRRTIVNDLSPLAYVLTKAMTDPPSWAAMGSFLGSLEANYRSSGMPELRVPEDIRMLFSKNTLRQICFVRESLLTRPPTAWSQEELMIAGALAGILHGSRRRDGISRYLSISMPNTFSMSPGYVKKFIAENNLVPPEQDVFECLRDKLARLYLDAIDGPAGSASTEDASTLLSSGKVRAGSVDLLVTSPPYLQVVNYGTANWIRLWLMGTDEVGRQRGSGRQQLDAVLDHQHSYESYREFLLRTFKGVRRVLKRNGVAVFVIGDVANPGEEPVALASKIWEDIGAETGLCLVDRIVDTLAAKNKVSRIWGDTKGQATNKDCVLVLGRADGTPRSPAEDIDWEEPYKDGGPDAAHARFKDVPIAS
jgi:hypothetical protein